MAKKKASGAKAKQGGNVAGKRLGLKVASGSSVSPGQILLRQRGRKVIPGANTSMGRDFTIFSKIKGVVEFVNVKKNKKRIDVNKKT